MTGVRAAPQAAIAGLAGLLLAGCTSAPSRTAPAAAPGRGGFGEPLRGAPATTSPTLHSPKGEETILGQGTAPDEAEAQITLPDAVAAPAMEVAVARLRAELTGQGLEAFEDLMEAPPRVCCHSLTVQGAAALADPDHAGAVRVVVVWSAQPRGQGPPQQGTTTMLVTPAGGGWRVLPAWEAGV